MSWTVSDQILRHDGPVGVMDGGPIRRNGTVAHGMGPPWVFQGTRTAGANPPPHASAGLRPDVRDIAMTNMGTTQPGDGRFTNLSWLSGYVPAVPHLGKRPLPALPVAQLSPDVQARKTSFTQRMTGDGGDRTMHRGASPEPSGPTNSRCAVGDGWQKRLSKYNNPGRVYYVNRLTGLRAWDIPPDTAPSPQQASNAGNTFPGYSGAIGHQAPGYSGRVATQRADTDSGAIGDNFIGIKAPSGPAAYIRAVDDLANRRSPVATKYHQGMLKAQTGHYESASPVRLSIPPRATSPNSWHS